MEYLSKKDIHSQEIILRKTQQWVYKKFKKLNQKKHIFSSGISLGKFKNIFFIDNNGYFLKISFPKGKNIKFLTGKGLYKEKLDLNNINPIDGLNDAKKEDLVELFDIFKKGISPIKEKILVEIGYLYEDDYFLHFKISV